MNTSQTTIDIVVNIVNETEVEMFDWNETQFGWLQSKYFIGYMGTMVIGVNVIQLNSINRENLLKI